MFSALFLKHEKKKTDDRNNLRVIQTINVQRDRNATGIKHCSKRSKSEFKFFIDFLAAPSCEEALSIADQQLPDGEYQLKHGKVS